MNLFGVVTRVRKHLLRPVTANLMKFYWIDGVF